MNDNRPTHLDLFSGIGGFSLAFESAGFRTVGFSEIDQYASAVLQKHWPDVPNFGDVRNITTESVGSIDVVTGGFPCQPFSSAGKKGGDSDERFLWPECVRVLCEVRPSFALFENVSGLLSIDGGRTFNRVLSDLVQIGFDCLWNCLPACSVGAPHERDRVWILAYSHGVRLEAASTEGQLLPKAYFGGWRNGYVPANGRPALPMWDGFAPRVTSFCGMADGIPHRPHRLRGTGNAIVPKAAQIFAKAIYNQITTL